MHFNRIIHQSQNLILLMLEKITISKMSNSKKKYQFFKFSLKYSIRRMNEVKKVAFGKANVPKRLKIETYKYNIYNETFIENKIK